MTEQAQGLMEGDHLKAAGKLLQGCTLCLNRRLPPNLLFEKAFMFHILNSKAQLCNRHSDVQGSMKCLEEGVEIANDPRCQVRTELPLAETYLNLANAGTFLKQYKPALQFSEKAFVYSSQTCERIESYLADPSNTNE